MNDEPDPLLTRLFAEQGQPEHATDFMAQFIDLLERERRNRRMYRIGTIVAGVMVAVLLAPWVAQLAAIAIGLVMTGITATASLADLPMASLVVGSIVAGFFPVIYLATTRRW